jgi:hypothetical protein
VRAKKLNTSGRGEEGSQEGEGKGEGEKKKKELETA